MSLAPNRSYSSSHFTDGHYVPLGGQHISAALLQVFKMAGGNQDDIGISHEMQFVDAEVLKVSTPKEVCRLAAGEHQITQRDVQSMSVADIFSLMTKFARDKLQSKLGTRYLSDNEVLMVCQQCGLTKFQDRNGKELTESQSVCYQFGLLRIGATFFFITEDDSGTGLEAVCILGFGVL